MKETLIKELSEIEKFFETSTDCLKEENCNFRPVDGALSVVEHVAHAAQSIEWFVAGMTSYDGFDLNFESHWEEVGKVKTLHEARSWFSKAIEDAISTIQDMSEDELSSLLPEGEVMGKEPKYKVVPAIAEHTAHHRGALTVYSRLLGKEPKMPYA